MAAVRAQHGHCDSFLYQQPFVYQFFSIIIEVDLCCLFTSVHLNSPNEDEKPPVVFQSLFL